MNLALFAILYFPCECNIPCPTSKYLEGMTCFKSDMKPTTMTWTIVYDGLYIAHFLF